MKFDNTFVRELPGDKETSNTLRQVHFRWQQLSGGVQGRTGGMGATSGRPHRRWAATGISSSDYMLRFAAADRGLMTGHGTAGRVGRAVD